MVCHRHGHSTEKRQKRKAKASPRGCWKVEVQARRERHEAKISQAVNFSQNHTPSLNPNLTQILTNRHETHIDIVHCDLNFQDIMISLSLMSITNKCP